MIDKTHYFDWAATAPADEDIAREALAYSLEHWANPSSIHDAGSDARKALEADRERCAKALGVNPKEIYFTSGGTEGDHIPLVSVLSRPQRGSVLISSIEHPAMREMGKALANTGWKLITVPSDKNGFVRSEAIINALQSDTVFVGVMAVNNETGAVQDIPAIAAALDEWGKGRRRPHLHVDCVQAAGKIPLDLASCHIDSASISAHKIGGPRGIGILYLKKEITAFLRGGGQERSIRSGTENLFGAHAMALCLEKYAIRKENKESMDRYDLQCQYTASFLDALKGIKGCSILPSARTDFPDSAYSPWIVQAAFPGIPGQVMERALSAKGFYISTGSACSSGHHDRPVLDAMGVSAKEKESAVRFSFGSATTKKAMDELLEAVREVTAAFA